MPSEPTFWLQILTTAVATIAGLAGILVKVWGDTKEAKTARERVLDAEKEAFRTLPEAFLQKTRELSNSQVDLERRTKDLADLIEHAQGALRVGVLFDVYSKQIEKYQTETQARAGWSFIFSIVSMLSALGFIVWGGVKSVDSGGWETRVLGATLSAVGAGLSAFISKTFLDVHRLSLVQLNRYFRQPVLNSHILTAQRLADQLSDASAKESAYKLIIERIVALVREEEFANNGAATADGVLGRRVPPKTRREKGGATKAAANPRLAADA